MESGLLLAERKTRDRRAFTLVELLVVIAIIGILVALLLPAVQSAREASRRVKCGNNLRQLAVGVSLFEEAHNQVPPNRYGDYDAPATYGGPYEDSRSWSWLAALLPYIEQQQLFDKGQIPDKRLDQSGVVNAAISVFLCPSDTASIIKTYPERTRYMRTGIMVGLTSYKGVQGANFCWGDWANGTTNSLDCEPWWHGDGILYSMDFQRPKPFAAVDDGLSNTFLAGEDIWNETRSTCSSPCYGLGFAWAHPVEAVAIGAIPPNARRPNGQPYAADDWTGHNGFRSQHPTGLQFAYCDGSVRFIRDTIPLGIYRAHCTISGRETLPQE